VTTHHWRPGEASLARDSFNDIVSGRKTNVPAVLMRTTSLSRLAMLARPLLEPPVHLPPPQLRRSCDNLFDKLLDFNGTKRSVQLEDDQRDGFGSIRLGTPTPVREEEGEEGRRRPPPMAVTIDESLGRSTLERTDRSGVFPAIRPTPAARYGYMPPGAGRILRQPSGQKIDPAGISASDLARPGSELSSELLGKITKLYLKMDRDQNGQLTRKEAKEFFKHFSEISTNAMFDEVDEDHNDAITMEEFRSFWQQVKDSGYSEEDLSLELDELSLGNAWVNYQDSRDVGTHRGE